MAASQTGQTTRSESSKCGVKRVYLREREVCMQNAGMCSSPAPLLRASLPLLLFLPSYPGVDKARKIASKYTGAGQSFRVKVKDLHIFFTSLIKSWGKIIL